MYSLPYSCGAILLVVINSMNSAFSPWLGENLYAQNYKRIKEVSYYYVLLLGLMSVFLFLLAPEILLLLGGEAYYEAKYVMPPVILGYIFVYIYMLYTNIEQYEKKTKGVAVATVMAALVNMILNAVLIPRFGYVSAAYTTLVGYIFLFLFHFIMVKKMKLDIVYDTCFIFIFLIAEIMVAMVSNYLYQYYFVRYIVTLLYGLCVAGILFKNRDKILQIVRKKR